MRYIKLVAKIGFLIVMLSLISIYGAGKLVENNALGKIYESTCDIPHNKVGLLLGTSKVLSTGRVNLYYKYRIDAAAELYKSGKVDFLIVSGDNSTKNYDEPSTMKEDLIKEGVPSGKIFLDYAGFRTLDSVVRSKEIFGQKSVTVISQQFHNERAIYIAKYIEVEAVGFNAKDVNVHYGFKTRLRERFARVKMIMDLVFGKNPKFLGEKIEVK